MPSTKSPRRSVGGLCAETGGALTLFPAAGLGIPASSMHTFNGTIAGLSSMQRVSAVSLGAAGNIVWAWSFAIPAPAFVVAAA